MLSAVWTAQRCSQSYTEKRRGREETEVARRIKGGNEICIEESIYELTEDNIFVIVRRKISV